MVIERNRLKRMKDVVINSSEQAEKKFSDHEENMFR